MTRVDMCSVLCHYWPVGGIARPWSSVVEMTQRILMGDDRMSTTLNASDDMNYWRDQVQEGVLCESIK